MTESVQADCGGGRRPDSNFIPFIDGKMADYPFAGSRSRTLVNFLGFLAVNLCLQSADRRFRSSNPPLQFREITI